MEGSFLVRRAEIGVRRCKPLRGRPPPAVGIALRAAHGAALRFYNGVRRRVAI